jgi:hypothetical protein
MKLNFTQPFIACTFLALLSVHPYRSAAVEKIPVTATEDPAEKKPATKSRTRSSRNNHAVKIYPDVLKRVMHVVAKNNNGKGIDFFVFDLQGTLIQHYKMSGGEHQRLASLERGKYVYNVFAGDEETASGQFEIR